MPKNHSTIGTRAKKPIKASSGSLCPIQRLTYLQQQRCSQTASSTMVLLAFPGFACFGHLFFRCLPPPQQQWVPSNLSTLSMRLKPCRYRSHFPFGAIEESTATFWVFKLDRQTIGCGLRFQDPCGPFEVIGHQWNVKQWILGKHCQTWFVHEGTKVYQVGIVFDDTTTGPH